jgi:hypothetical protein
MKVEVPEKVIDLLDEIFDLVGIPDDDLEGADKPQGLGWFTLSFGVPNDGIICAIKFRNSDILSLARYNGDQSCWEYHTCQWIQVPDIDDNIELWHPLPKFQEVEL